MDPSTKDWIDALSKIAIPITLAWVGFLIVRRVEKQKARVSRASDFKKRWADNFYETSQEFMQSTERYMAILSQLQSMSQPNNTFGTKLQQELNELNVHLGELHLAIKRLAYFAPLKGRDAIQSATEVQSYLSDMVRNMNGSFDKLISLQNSFNRATREAHAEMLDYE